MIPNEDAYAFEEQSILNHAPNQIGVYVIFRPNQWLYVGHGDIQTRLLGHVHGDIPDLHVEDAPWFMFERCPSEQAATERAKVLTYSYRPLCN